MEIRFVEPVPQSEGMYYATNNPYQVNGPRGFTEFKVLDGTAKLFVRIDFPGVRNNSVKILLDPSQKAVFVSGEAPQEMVYDASLREFGTATGLLCDCCRITNVESVLGDGVLRLILSKETIDFRVGSSCSARAYTSVRASSSLSRLIRGYDPEVAGGHPLAHLRGHGPQGHRGTDPLDPAFTGPDIVPNPLVQTGSTSAYESKQLSDGGLFLRIDMPGVPNDKFAVTVENGCVTVTGRAPAAMDDSSGREYRGNVAVVPRDYDSRRIEAFANEGVIRLIIHSI
ncbi:putative 57 kDa heat shock protein isoform X2 [Brassica rapa]|uniref:SHSP domain-containing protein n=1 Tax=Brassica campestris TaxID=3711 RepID=M4CVJ7_BRACM|nr:putative 57 kDa heat shock protein isoform X2 [Brassica rapa]